MPLHPDVAKLIAGGLPDDLVLVGGQAALYFAAKYAPDEPALGGLQALTSVDSDFLGRREHLSFLRERLGVEPQIPPRKGGMLALSLARFPTGAGNAPHIVELLGNVRGVREQEVLRTALVEATGHGPEARFRIINPVLLLEAKAANVLELEQAARNDLGHLWIAAFSTRAYLRHLNRTPERGRAMVTFCNRVLDLADSHRGSELLSRFRLDVTQCIPGVEPNDPSIAQFLDKGLPRRMELIRRRAESEGLSLGVLLEDAVPKRFSAN